MRKINYFILLTIVLVGFGFSFITPTYAQLQNLENVNVKVISIDKISSDNSDVLKINVSFINEGNSASQILANTIFLVDSKQREFTSSSYLELKEKDYDVSSKDCPLLFTINVNPGLTENANLCYEIPKDVNLKYSLKLYESTPEICAEPIFDCTIKTFPINVGDGNSESKLPSKIPEWIKNIFVWYGQGQVSEGDLLNAIKYLVKQDIIQLD
ncbi:DUF4352 domain-containing protein [Nitrosopumilus sp.]|uniref:DUF4352 domain-containing protein n=1 Tax=Nitrosopumilus sp. TaxID=2024843 RepID=UPI0034A0A850